MRKTRRMKKIYGGFISELGNAVYSGFKQGLKNVPKELRSSIKSSGSSYLTPTGSIANYAGNNIQNIIKSHNESFRRNMGNKINTLKTTTFKNKNKKHLMPLQYIFKQQQIKPSSLQSYNSKLNFNNKYTPINNKDISYYNKEINIRNTKSKTLM